jgi:hypothetical protein
MLGHKLLYLNWIEETKGKYIGKLKANPLNPCFLFFSFVVKKVGKLSKFLAQIHIKKTKISNFLPSGEISPKKKNHYF